MPDLPIAGDPTAQIRARTGAYPSPRAYFVRRVAEGVSTIGAAFSHPSRSSSGSEELPQ